MGYRDCRHGSLMIQVLVDVLKASAERDDLEDLFRKVCFTGECE